jgi:folate-dependent tRNA-U54 methylase TrmFO/GidA
MVNELDVVYFDIISPICNMEAVSCSAFTDDRYKKRSDLNHWTLELAKLLGVYY